ncbi:MAG: stage II sporulation protein M [Bacilli bacterium]|nr:stage II sporulation protein M [Bacilli bacterium]
MDKVKIFKVNKKLSYCILIITIIAIVAGSLFLTILKDTDKTSIFDSLDLFINNINNNELSYGIALKSSLISNLLIIFLIWLLGISIIGIPVILFIYFIKAFALGLSISSLIAKFGMKGCIYALFYIFPHHIINLAIFAILSIYSIIYSFKLSESFFKKEQIDFKPIMDKHKYVLLLSILIVILTSLYGTYIMPYVFKIVLNFIK